MSRPLRIVGALVVVAAAAAVVLIVIKVQESQQEADLFVDEFEEQLAAMDPVARAAALARISSDGLKKVKEARQG